MIIPDKKKVASVIVSKLQRDGSEKSAPLKPEAPLMDEAQPLHAIAEDLILALKDGSAASVVTALKAFLEQCDLAESDDIEA